jgi:hypothetical protein
MAQPLLAYRFIICPLIVPSKQCGHSFWSSIFSSWQVIEKPADGALRLLDCAKAYSTMRFN